MLNNAITTLASARYLQEASGRQRTQYESCALAAISGKKDSAGVVSEVARNALHTRVHGWQMLFPGHGCLAAVHELLLHAFLEQLPAHFPVAERQRTDGSQDLGLLHGF